MGACARQGALRHEPALMSQASLTLKALSATGPSQRAATRLKWPLQVPLLSCWDDAPRWPAALMMPACTMTCSLADPRIAGGLSAS